MGPAGNAGCVHFFGVIRRVWAYRVLKSGYGPLNGASRMLSEPTFLL